MRTFRAIDQHGAAWRYIPKLKENFRLSEEDMRTLLGDMPLDLYKRGVKTHKSKFSKDQLDRISFLLGIQKSLLILFSGQKERAFGWIDRENSLPPFYGITPREFLLKGDFQNLYETRRALDANI
jgi:hypothetical protein